MRLSRNETFKILIALSMSLGQGIASAADYQVSTAGGCIPLYKEANANSASVGCLNNGTVVNVTQNGNFSGVTTQAGQRGFVYTPYLKPYVAPTAASPTTTSTNPGPMIINVTQTPVPTPSMTPVPAATSSSLMQQALPLAAMAAMSGLGGGSGGKSSGSSGSTSTNTAPQAPQTASTVASAPAPATQSATAPQAATAAPASSLQTNSPSPATTRSFNASAASRSADSPSAASSIAGKTDADPPSKLSCESGNGATDMWSSVKSVATDKVIPTGSGYSITAGNFPKLESSGGKLTVRMQPNLISHCSSATGAAFYKHIADLQNSGKLSLNQSQIQYLNSLPVRMAILGNTNSMALLYEYLGGQSMRGEGSGIASVLEQARPGDILKFDRFKNARGKYTGHSTIFKEFKNGQVCFWSSNEGTNGVGEKCEPVSRMMDVVVSRFPSDLSALPGRIDKMKGPSQASSRLMGANGTKEKEISWSGTLVCSSSKSQDRAPSASGGDK